MCLLPICLWFMQRCCSGWCEFKVWCEFKFCWISQRWSVCHKQLLQATVNWCSMHNYKILWTLFSFYRVMLCIAWTMPWQDVCLSVHLSITCRYYVKMAEHILILISPSRNHTILVLPHQTIIIIIIIATTSMAP